MRDDGGGLRADVVARQLSVCVELALAQEDDATVPTNAHAGVPLLQLGQQRQLHFIVGSGSAERAPEGAGRRIRVERVALALGARRRAELFRIRWRCSTPARPRPQWAPLVEVRTRRAEHLRNA